MDDFVKGIGSGIHMAPESRYHGLLSPVIGTPYALDVDVSIFYRPRALFL